MSAQNQLPNSTVSHESEHSWGQLTLTALATILFVRIISLYFNPTDLFFDEAQYWLWGKELAFGYFSKPPLLGWTIGAFTAVCGSDSEFCVRLPSPILHSITAGLIYLSAARLFDPKTGFWSALTYITLPGITLSSTLISTDVPLLLSWAGALWAFIRLRAELNWTNAILLGVFLGFGMMAKYAMAYFVMCSILFALIDRQARAVVFSAKAGLSLLISLAILAPNVWWNAQHKFITASHTGDNIGWSRGGLNPIKALEFLGSQFGVFGPILFAFLLIALFRFVREGWDSQQKFLVLFSIPVLALITIQGLLSKAYANWAAVTYIAASILVADLLVNRVPPIWKKVSFSIHFAIFAVFVIAIAFAAPGNITLPGNKEPFERLHGWSEIGKLTQKQLEQDDYVAVLGTYRHITAALVYYLRNQQKPVFALKRGARIHDHYELTRAYAGKPSGAVLLVSGSQEIAEIVPLFETVYLEKKVTLNQGTIRQLWFFRLEGYRGMKLDVEGK